MGGNLLLNNDLSYNMGPILKIKIRRLIVPPLYNYDKLRQALTDTGHKYWVLIFSSCRYLVSFIFAWIRPRFRTDHVLDLVRTGRKPALVAQITTSSAMGGGGTSHKPSLNRSCSGNIQKLQSQFFLIVRVVLGFCWSSGQWFMCDWPQTALKDFALCTRFLV